mgnify:CR=1 FL=1
MICKHCGAEFDWSPLGDSCCSIMCAQGTDEHGNDEPPYTEREAVDG